MTTRNDPLTFGDFMKNYRLGEEMTQEELAHILGVSKQRICDIEKNRFNISIKLCKHFAKKLKLPAEWLVKLALQDQLNNEGLKLKVG